MKTAVVIPNWNGEDFLKECIDSLLAQTKASTVIVVDNGSIDTSRKILQEYGDQIVCIYNKTNLGFAGGVNAGIRYVIDHNFDAVALFNNDAVADKNWLKNLVSALSSPTGIVTGCFQSLDKTHIDSTGDQLTVWGLPYPRWRGHSTNEDYRGLDKHVFGATGGASLYSIKMLKEIGLFDEDFFAYYEDVDISYRAQLAGWKVMFVPEAIAYHHIGATSSKIKGFTTYQTMKNLPILWLKNTPKGLLWKTGVRFFVAYKMFFISAVLRGQFIPAFKGWLRSVSYIPKKLYQRRFIQKNMVVTSDYIFGIMTHDLPENSDKLRKLRSFWWKLSGRKA